MKLLYLINMKILFAPKVAPRLVQLEINASG